MAPRFLAVMAALALPAIALGLDLPIPGGLVGLDTATGAGWLAILVPVPENSAVSGLMWYNNDGSVVFPQILAATGYPSGPGLIADALPVATGVGGSSLAWSEVVFSEPVAASVGSLYLVFAFPEGPEFTAEGLGGGPAIGFGPVGGGCQGWISGDGEEWSRLQDSYRFTIVPTYVAFEPGMAVKSLDQPRGGVALVTEAPYFTVAPNPFNPQTEVRFGLPKPAHVVIDIFDVRGRRVQRIAAGEVRGRAACRRLVWGGREGTWGRQWRVPGADAGRRPGDRAADLVAEVEVH